MPRFVLLKHDHPFLHWDFMLERDGTLQTWRLDRQPSLDEEVRIAAAALPDHRITYLEYEGPVSGDRGSVVRVDRGEFAFVSCQAESIVIELQGTLLQGEVRMTARAADSGEWQFDYRPSRSNPEI